MNSTITKILLCLMLHVFCMHKKKIFNNNLKGNWSNSKLLIQDLPKGDIQFLICFGTPLHIQKNISNVVKDIFTWYHDRNYLFSQKYTVQYCVKIIYEFTKNFLWNGDALDILCMYNKRNICNRYTLALKNIKAVMLVRIF